MKFLMVGFDGLGFNSLMNNLNVMPTFKDLISKYRYGSMETVKINGTPFTFPNWGCIYDGVCKDEILADIDYRLFKIVSKKFSVGIFNMPSMIKLWDVNGFIVAGFPFSPSYIKYEDNVIRNGTYPPELIDEMPYTYNNEHFLVLNTEKYIKQEFKMIDIFLKLCSRFNVDCAFYGTSLIDHYGHLISKNPLDALNSCIDSMMKKLMFLNPEKLVVCSDHGYVDWHTDDAFYLINDGNKRFDMHISDLYWNILNLLDLNDDRTDILGDAVISDKAVKERLRSLGYSL